MQTLVNILPIIVVAVILIGAIGFIASGTRLENREKKKEKNEFDLQREERRGSTEYGWRPLPPGVDKEAAAAAFIPSLRLDSPEEEIEVEDAPAPRKGEGMTYWKGEKPPARYWKGEKEKTEPKPVLRAFDFKES